jgi:hypothetical protein
MQIEKIILRKENEAYIREWHPIIPLVFTTVYVMKKWNHSFVGYLVKYALNLSNFSEVFVY